MSKIHLLRNYITRSGNLYAPGFYEEGHLPEQCLDIPGLTERIGGDSVLITEAAKKSQMITDFSSEQSKQAKEKTEFNIIQTQTTVQESKLERTAINKASLKELTALKGIGQKTAEQIIEAREKSPFLGISDLKERVELPFSGKWDTYKLSFE